MNNNDSTDTHFTITYHGKPVGGLAVQIEGDVEGLDVPHLCQSAAVAVCGFVADYREVAEDDEAMPWAVTIRFGGEEEGRGLNRDFRHKDYATNVLSFVSDEDEPDAEEWYVGDMFICTPVLVREAAEMGKPLSEHLQHLVVHGMLHLVGYDHELGDKEAALMEGLEREILNEMGLPDPYPADEKDA